MYHFIINPASRTGRGRELWNRLEAILKEKNVEYSAHFTEIAGDATRIAKEITENCSDTATNIIIVGGDGTVNETINGICDNTKVTLGYIPTGSGNDFGRGLKCPKNPEKALENILSPKSIQAIDQGCISFFDGTPSKKFAVSSGIGYDAESCCQAVPYGFKKFLNKLKLGSLVYILIAIKQIFKTKPIDMELIVDGDKKLEFKKVLFIATMCQRYEGGGFAMNPHATPTDGELSICVAHGLSIPKVLFLMIMLALTKHEGFKGIDLFNCKTIEINAKEARTIHTDGEFSGFHSHIKLSSTTPINMFLSEKL